MGEACCGSQEEQATMEKHKTANVIEDIQNDPNKLAFAVGIFVGVLTLFLIFVISSQPWNIHECAVNFRCISLA